MHRVHPLRPQRLEPVDDLSDRLLVSEDPDLAVEPAHLRAQILVDDRRLRSGLDVEVGREDAPGRLVEEHHRVPVRGAEPQRVGEVEVDLAQGPVAGVRAPPAQHLGEELAI